MLQTTKLMHNNIIIIRLFIVLIIEVNTISAVDVNSNVITIAATQKIISNSTEDSGTESQLLCSSLDNQMRNFSYDDVCCYLWHSARYSSHQAQ